MKLWKPKIKIGKLVRYFVLADLALLAGWGLISPVFAVFILNRVAGSTVITLGIGAAIYWLSKSVMQVPIAIMLDKTPSERDDFIFLVSGLILAGITAMGFILIKEIWQLYLFEFLHAVSFAFYVPAWSGIFSRHLDKNHRSLDFTLDSTSIGVASGITAVVSGFIVTWFGFNTIFVLASLFSFASAIIIFMTPELVFPHRSHKGVIIHNHSPKTIGK